MKWSFTLRAYYRILRYETERSLLFQFSNLKASKWMRKNLFGIYRIGCCGHTDYDQKEEDELLVFLVTTEQEFVEDAMSLPNADQLNGRIS